MKWLKGISAETSVVEKIAIIGVIALMVVVRLQPWPLHGKYIIIIIPQLAWVTFDLYKGFRQKRLKYKIKKWVNSLRPLFGVVWTFCILLWAIREYTSPTWLSGSQTDALVTQVFMWTIMWVIVWWWRHSSEPFWKYTDKEKELLAGDVDWFTKRLNEPVFPNSNNRILKWLKKLDDKPNVKPDCTTLLAIFYVGIILLFGVLPLVSIAVSLGW